MGKKVVEIIEHDTDEVIETMDVDGWPERRVEKMIRGMLINMDQDRFSVRERTIKED